MEVSYCVYYDGGQAFVKGFVEGERKARKGVKNHAAGHPIVTTLLPHWRYSRVSATYAFNLVSGIVPIILYHTLNMVVTQAASPYVPANGE